jgi:two-component system response regulator YesN
MYTILIADDEALERKALRKILSENIPEISRIEESYDGQSALEKAREILPDLIILDIKMPRLNGLDAARKIKMFHPTCRIILLSGYTYFNYAKEAVSIGINDFLVKPVSDEELIASVKNLLDGLEKQKKQSNNGDNKTEKMDNIYSCLENEFVTTLPFQQIREPYLSNHLKALDINYLYSISVILAEEQQTKIDVQDFEKLKNIVKSTFSENRVLLQKIDNLIYGIIFFSQFIQDLQLKEDFNKLVCELSNKMSKTVHIGLGTIKNRPSEIFDSFNEARRALSSEKVISLFQPNFSTKKITSIVEKEEKLIDSVLNGDIENSLAIFSEVYQILDTNCKDYLEFKIRVYEMLLVLKRRVRRELAVEDNLVYQIHLDDCLNRNEIKTYLIQEIHKLLDKVTVFLTTSNKAWKQQVISYLEQHLHETVTLQELADIACFSPSYLSRKFKEEFGMNCINYLNYLKINEAKKLLLRSNLSIKEIAYTLGYNDANYFARVFKKETGINASKYKNSAT